MKNFNLPIKNF